MYINNKVESYYSLIPVTIALNLRMISLKIISTSG